MGIRFPWSPKPVDLGANVEPPNGDGAVKRDGLLTDVDVPSSNTGATTTPKNAWDFALQAWRQQQADRSEQHDAATDAFITKLQKSGVSEDAIQEFVDAALELGRTDPRFRPTSFLHRLQAARRIWQEAFSILRTMPSRSRPLDLSDAANIQARIGDLAAGLSAATNVSTGVGASKVSEGLVAPFTADEIEALVAEHGAPLLLVDCDTIRTQYRALRAALPGVRLHFALKPLPEADVAATLRDEGASFDVASVGEIDLLKSQNVAGDKCIHTHPIKSDAEINAALDRGVNTFVVDNLDELAKFERYSGRASVMLRLSFRNPEARTDLSKKFGCDPKNAEALLKRARDLGVDICGLCFHVGSQSANSKKHVEAIESCTEIIQHIRREGLADIRVLDIGGGFPANYGIQPVPPIDEFCAPIRDALKNVPGEVQVLAEPGRYLVATSGTVVARVEGYADRGDPPKPWLYLDTGVYDLFSGIFYDDHRPKLESIRPREGANQAFVVAGPTCDSVDIVSEGADLPPMEIGDLLVARNMGAYSSVNASDFNFVRRAKVVAVNRKG